MIVGLRCLVCGVVLVCAILCPAALAADDEGPQTGTIEVEVVYKDTGEPVEGVYVRAVPLVEGNPSGALDWQGATSQMGRFVIGDVPPGLHGITVRNPERWDYWFTSEPSRLLSASSETQRTVTVSDENPAVRVRFDVSRGWELSGSVRRPDGSPFEGAVVAVMQGRTKADLVYAKTDQTGQFEMLGVQPSEKARVTVFSIIGMQGGGEDVGFVPVWDDDVVLTGESTCVHLEVATTSLECVCLVSRDLLSPDPNWSFLGSYPVAIWVGGRREAEQEPDAMTALEYHEHGRRPGLWGRYYRVCFDDLPVDSRVTVGLGIRVRLHDDPQGRTNTCRFVDSLTVTTARETKTVTLAVYEPGARLSRALLFGVPAAIVLAVCVTILVRQARRRRATER